MAYCRKCGTEIDDDAVICPKCGVQQKEMVYKKPVNDEGSILWAILGFIIPIVGIILWIVWYNERPKDAKMAGIGALISIVVGIVLYFLVFAAIFTQMGNINWSF